MHSNDQSRLLRDADPEAIADRSFYGLDRDPASDRECGRNGSAEDQAVCRPTPPSRRRFLLGAGAAAGTLLAPGGARAAISQLMCPPAIGSFARSGGGDGGSSGGEGLPADYSSAVPDDGPGSRVIRLFRPRFGETFEAEFVQNGSYNQAALEQFNHFCRDGGGAVGPMDPKVLDLCWTIWRKLNMTEPLSITSGYRSPVYNAGTKGAAKNSYHMKGCALDIQSSQRSPREIYAAAMAEAVGGVGRYNSFTHIDTRGYHTTWSG